MTESILQPPKERRSGLSKGARSCTVPDYAVTAISLLSGIPGNLLLSMPTTGKTWFGKVKGLLEEM
jgi:hypothetical protein